MFPLASLNRIPEAVPLVRALLAPVKNPTLGKKLCPICAKRMRLAYTGGGTLEADRCPYCHLVWFDKGEIRFEKGKRLAYGAEKIIEAPVPAETPADQAVLSGDWLTVETALHGVLGLPQEENVELVRDKVWLVYVLVGLCIVFSMGPHSAEMCGLLAKNPWRYFGATWITSIFVHGGITHLLGNGYFLWLYGDNVEDFLGTWAFLELFLLSALAGSAASLLLVHAPNALYVGASGGIMGLAVFYGLTFPRAKLSFYFPIVIFAFRLKIPTYVYLLVFLTLEYVLADRRGTSNVGHFSHLGGAAVGIIYWALTERREQRAVRRTAKTV